MTVSGLVALLIVRTTSADQAPQWALGPAVTQAMTTISVMLVILACVNAAVISWTTALDARRAAALTRAMGATRQQLTAGLCAAQTLPALAGALLGIPGGIALYDLATSNTGPTRLPPALSLAALILGTLLVLGVLSAVASRLNIRQPIAEQLRAETG